MRELSAAREKCVARQGKGGKARQHAACAHDAKAGYPANNKGAYMAYAPSPTLSWRLFLAVGQAMIIQFGTDGAATEMCLAIRHLLPAVHVALRHVAGGKCIRRAQAERELEGRSFLDHGLFSFG